MKHSYTCKLHPVVTRPDVCSDCARHIPAPLPRRMSIPLDSTVLGQVERFQWVDAHGVTQVGFREVVPITRHHEDMGVWALVR